MNNKLFELDLHDDRVLFVEAKPAGWAGEMSVSKLYESLKDSGIPENKWPSPPSDNKCLERALQSLRSQRSLVRPLARGQGFSLVLENVTELDKETFDDAHAHNVELTCKVEKATDTTPVHVRITPWDHPAAPLIQQEFERYRGNDESKGLFKCCQDLSVWFSQTIVPWCRGISTRSRGGSYYIMKGEYLNRIMKVSGALDNASETKQTTIVVSSKSIPRVQVLQGGRIILKPEVASTAAIEIIIDNIINECDKVCDQLDEDLHNDKANLRGIKSRKLQAEDSLNKLTAYEKLLGTNLTDVRDRLEEVKAGLGMAELRLMAEKDK